MLYHTRVHISSSAVINFLCCRNFFQLHNYIDSEAYTPQLILQKSPYEKCAHRRKWYKLHKAIIEFNVFSEAHVILELLVDSQTARVLSTWDLEGLKSFLEVGSQPRSVISCAMTVFWLHRDLIPGKSSLPRTTKGSAAS
jgi:hypothetical protein